MKYDNILPAVFLSRPNRFIAEIEVNGKTEIKGVTLEENGVVMFPDAPTERGVKHIKELCACMEDGYEAYLFFVIQMEHCRYFTPNRRTHPEFADALTEAEQKGVKIGVLNCTVTPDTLKIHMLL